MGGAVVVAAANAAAAATVARLPFTYPLTIYLCPSYPPLFALPHHHSPTIVLARHCLCLPAIVCTLPLSFMFADGAAAAVVVTLPTCSHLYLQLFVLACHHLHPPALVHVHRWSCCCCCSYCAHPSPFVFAAICALPPSFLIAHHHLCSPTIIYLHLHQI